MESSSLPAGEISGQVLLYSTPEPLSIEQHGKLGVKQVPFPFAFAAGAQLVPLTVAEFPPASLSFPIIFVGTDFAPVGVMGLREGQNLFIGTDRPSDDEAYMPAYIRRYPFVFAVDNTSDRMILCIERKASLFDETGGQMPLFEGGQPSEYVKNAMNFCRDFETEKQRTDNFVKMLRELDLFEIKQATFTPTNPDGSQGEAQLLAEYQAISEEKLNKLPKEKILELFENGALAHMYAHIMSLMNWQRLVTRAIAQDMKEAEAAATAGNA